MAEAYGQIGFVVVGAEPRPVFETLASLVEQSIPPERVWHVSRDDLREALNDLGSDWAVVIRAGSQLDPQWLARAQKYVGRDSIGVVGGRLLEFHGAQTAATWMAETAPIAWVDIHGILKSNLRNLPGRPVVAPALFLSWDNVMCRRRLLIDALSIDERLLWGEYATLPCHLARRRGMDVLYDSELRSCRSLDTPITAPEPIDLGAWHRVAKRRMLELGSVRTGLRACAALTGSLVIGSRVSPGLFMGLAYAWWPARKRRWRAAVSGKVAALRALRG